MLWIDGGGVRYQKERGILYLVRSVSMEELTQEHSTSSTGSYSGDRARVTEKCMEFSALSALFLVEQEHRKCEGVA